MSETIYALDEGLTEQDDLLDSQLAMLATVLMQGRHDEPGLQVRLAGAYIRVGLRLCHAYDMAAYYKFLGRVMKLAVRESAATRQWAETYLQRKAS
jgi:hypothetical protein